MALITWLPLSPLVWIAGQVNRRWMTKLPTPLTALITAGVIVVVLQFFVMPTVIRGATRWLDRRSPGGRLSER
jgi:antibiotic biosynthesis monooxygenase (ABM) superfamily enzyme